MLSFILNNFIFDFIICLLVLINFILTTIIDHKQIKNDLYSIKKINIVLKCKLTIILLTLVTFMVFIYNKFTNYINLIIYFIIPFIFLIKNLYNMYMKKQSLSIDNKYSILWSAYIFIVFFSSQATPIYYKSLSPLNHEFKEFLLILYLLTKIILFVYMFFTNIAILISNINILKPIKLTKKHKTVQYYKIKDYDFILYKKYKHIGLFIVDFIIYFLLCVPTIILNLLLVLILKTISKFKCFFKYIIYKMYDFDSNNNKIIKKITNISIITAFSMVYIIIIINKSIFISQNIVDIYNFISTVILIPFIYDSIKTK